MNRGIGAVRARPSDAHLFSCALSGEYRFGMVVKFSNKTSNICIILVFMSPETAVRDPWRRIFSCDKLVIVAFDEAHCIAEWLATLLM